jgi:head-tail adaptor
MSPISTTLHDVTPTTLRGLTFLSLSEVGHVLARTYGDDSGGGQTGTYTQGSAIACRVDPVGGREGIVADRLDERTTHKITVPPDTTVSAADRFSVTTFGTFEITAVRARTDEQVRILEATEDF